MKIDPSILEIDCDVIIEKGIFRKTHRTKVHNYIKLIYKHEKKYI